MDNNLELQQMIYNVVKTQIKFGAYRFGERLPKIEDAARLFLVSVRTIRTAYQRLERAGYITVSKGVGAKVKTQYGRLDTEAHIQQFFAERKNSLPDLGRSMQVLLSKAQWLGFKNASPELLEKMERLVSPKENLTPYIMIQQLQYIYGALGNDLLMRLVWQEFMFFLAPFFSVPGNLKNFSAKQNPLLEMIALCRQQSFTALQSSVEAFHEQRIFSLCRFYEERIQLSPPKRQIAFAWSGYKKASQLCYTLGMELLVAISRGVYPSGALLPSLDVLAREKRVSVNTVRRTLSLLNGIGVTKSVNGVGTRVLPPEQIAENCDLSQPAARERLLDYAKSLHILTLSCTQAARTTICSLDKGAAQNWKERLEICARTQRYELVPYAILSLISRDAPYLAVRTVYAELFRQLFWGYPLRSMLKDPQAYKVFYLPYFNFFQDCLDRFDADGFSAKLEELMKHELKFATDQLAGLGIGAAAKLVWD